MSIAHLALEEPRKTFAALHITPTVGTLMTHTGWRYQSLTGSWRAPQSWTPPSPLRIRVGGGFTVMRQEDFCVQLTTTGTMQCKLFQLRFTCWSWLFHSCSHWQNICNFHRNFLVTAESWPAFLYPGGQFDPDDKGLFKGEILVRVSPLYED